MRFIRNSYSKQQPSANFLAEASQKFDITPKIMEQIILRGNDTIEKIEEFLNPTKASFLNAFDLKNMHAFIERIRRAKETKETVLVFGDYDVDGISATAIMLKALKIFGISARYYLPNRYVDGYGLTNDVLKKIKRIYNPSLIITVDCGISCYKEVDFAKTIGIEILVTDHHEIPEILPNTIVLNAKLPNQKYSFNGLCGTGLAYKIAEALIGIEAERFLPIAALATIADIVPLISENRTLVYFGLKKLDGLPIGLKLLLENLGIKLNSCSAMDISFKVAPKLNASGRMGDAQDSLKLYLSEDVTECKKLIDKILEHNDNRKNLCTVVEKDCENILSKVNLAAPAIILSSKDWDHGILGIICSKLVGIYHRPVFLFSEHNGEMKGSARSIPGINVHKLLSDLQDVLEVFGGHPVAAGLTIKSENFDEFVRRVNAYLIKNYQPETFIPYTNYDLEVEVDELTPKFLKDLTKLEPCGCENETLKLYLNTENFEFTPMRNFYNHCNLVVDKKLNLVRFDGLADYPKLKYSKKVGIIFELQAGFRPGTIRGIVKAIDCELTDVHKFSEMEVISSLEELKCNPTGKAVYTKLKSLLDIEPKTCFGTAIVVNSEATYKDLINNFNLKTFVKLNICDGNENTGLNAIIIKPQTLEFARFYRNIILADYVNDDSYIAQINTMSDAKVYVVEQKNQNNFETFDCTRENFGKIYKDLSIKRPRFACLKDLYQKIKGKRELCYTFTEFYAAISVFQELKIIEINKIKMLNELKINFKIKTDLNNSIYYRKLLKLQKKCGALW